jgi:hypothetical protein
MLTLVHDRKPRLPEHHGKQWLFLHEIDEGRPTYFQEHLMCFAGGMFALGAAAVDTALADALHARQDTGTSLHARARVCVYVCVCVWFSLFLSLSLFLFFLPPRTSFPRTSKFSHVGLRIF